MKRMTEADANGEMLDDCELFSEISLIDLDSKKIQAGETCCVD